MSTAPVGGDTHSSGVEADFLDVGTKSDADEGPGGLRGGGRSVSAGVADDDVLAVVDDFVHPGGCVNRHPAAPVVPLKFPGNIGVLVGKDTVGEFQNLDADTVTVQDVGEFHADGAAADDHDGLGQIGAENLLFIGDDVVAEGHSRQHAHARSGRDHGVVEAQ